MTYRTTGGKTYTLATSISSTATTIRLSSFTEPISETPYTMAIIGSSIVYATIAPKSAQSEFISFTGITQNADGTADLTGVTRGLGRSYPYAASATYRLPHPGQSIFILSDAPEVFNKYGALDNDEVITGQWEAPDPVTAQGLVTRDWILALINGGAISINAVIEAGTAGETLVAGNLIYFSETDNEWLKTDADTASTVLNVKLGIAQGAGVNGGAISGGVLTYGTYTTSGLTQGDLCYASNTAGGINSGTSGTTPRVIGIAKSSTVLYFDPNFQNVINDYAVDAVGTDSYAVTLPGAYSAYYAGMTVKFKAGTANTGACTLAVNGGAAKNIKKDVSDDLMTGDILANQICVVVYDGTNFQIVSKTPTPLTPVITVLTTTSTVIGDSTTRFDITNPSGTTFRYTYDETGTDPSISAVNNPVNSMMDIQSSAFNSANNGTFIVTGSGANYFEVTNASGVVENDKTIGTGFMAKQNSQFSKTTSSRYVVIETIGAGGGGGAGYDGGASGGGGGGGGGGGYSKKTIASSSLSSSEPYIIGAAISSTFYPYSTKFSSYAKATGGLNGIGGTTSNSGGNAGTGTLGDINIEGSDGGPGVSTSSAGSSEQAGGSGGNSFYGGGGKGGTGSTIAGSAGNSYGGGGGGGGGSGNGAASGGAGTAGVIIITEYF